MTTPSSTTRLPPPPAGFRGVFRADDVARAVYSEAAGVARIMPRAVAVPADADDVVTLVRWAAATGTPLVPRGSGSSMANGAVGDGVIVDLRRLDGIASVERLAAPVRVGAADASAGATADSSAGMSAGTGRRAGDALAAVATLRAGAAVVRERIQQAALREGMTFPVDPSSGPFATIGGMVATHAAGSRTVRYGPLRDWIAGVECVFADGTRAWVRRGDSPVAAPALGRFVDEVAPRVRATPAEQLRHATRKESSGYGLAAFRERGDLLDLLIGSEGTLAIITAVEVRLAPLPTSTASLLAGFASLEDAAGTAAALGPLGASAVELLDRSFLEIAAQGGRALVLPGGLEAVLLVEAEGDASVEAGALMAAIRSRCEAGGAVHLETALSAEEEQRLWTLRHAASPILNELAPRLQSLQLVEDGCVPPGRFAGYVREVRAALARARFRGVIFGHAGDAHAHVNALVDVTEPDWRARCEQLLEEVTAAVARAGGTLAGEHGDGRLRTPLLERVWGPEARALFAATKAAFDPAGVLNPGVKVPAAGATPLEVLKYDPAAPALPAAAREALDRVVRERAWGLDRLALLGDGG